MTPKNKNIVSLALIALCMLMVAYANHFYNGFHFDDLHAIYDNVHIRNLQNIPRFFWDPSMFSADPEHFGLRSLVTTTLAIDYWMGGGLNLFYFHLSTFIWHIGLTVMLYFMYKRLFRQALKHEWVNYIALFTASLFALHTANAETINYIISRSDVQSTFCIVASFLIYIAYPAKRKWYLYVIPAIIGVFAKETVLVLVILLFFYRLLFEENLSVADIFKAKNFKAIGRTIRVLLPLFIVVVLVQAYTLSRITSIPGISNPAGYYWLTQCYVWLLYVSAFFLPVHLSADTDLTVILTVGDGRILLGLLFMAAYLYAIFKTSASARTKPIAFGLIWFGASLLPTSLAPFAEVMNDHRMYFAFAGLTLSVVWAISLWIIRREEQFRTNKIWRTALIAAIVLLFAAHSYGVYQRNEVWHSEESLWHDVTLKSPKNGRGFMNYGLALLGKGEIKKALEYYERAQTLIPEYSRVYTNMGIAHGLLGNHEAANQNFLKGIFLGGNLYESYVYYARYLKEQRKYEEAKAVGEQALQLQPHAMITLKVLMEVYMQLGLWADLERTSALALSLVPGDAESAKLLALAKSQRLNGKGAAPVPEVKNPTAEDFLNLSLAFYNMENYAECIEYCKKAIALKPDYADAYSNMAAAYNKLKQWNKGLEASKKALTIDPGHVLAKGNLEWAKRRTDP